MTITRLTFGSLLKRLRRETGLSQAALAGAAGFSTVYIGMLERGLRRPPEATVDALAAALELPAADHAALMAAVVTPTRRPALGLPSAVTSFVGRHVEIALVCEMFRRPEARLVTIVGTGGVGKTRLSIEIARQLRTEMACEVTFVPLDSVSAAQDVGNAIVDALRIPRRATVPSDELLADALQDRRLLIILDNFEHLLPAAQLVARVLAACPGVRVLASSRSPLSVYGERTFTLGPLPEPPGAASTGLESKTALDVLAAVASSDAGRLFVERAGDTGSAFRLTVNTAPHVARICRSVDGLPLGIELAAARIRHYSVEAVAGQLTHPLIEVTGGAAAAGARHDSLANVFTWSWQLLDSHSQAVLARLSTFSGGFTIEAAESVCAFPEEPSVESALMGLIDANLVQRTESAHGESRFAILQTVREYARLRLEDGTDAEEAASRHFTFFLSLAEAASSNTWSTGAVSGPVASDMANMNAALAWSRRARPWDGLRLATALADQWELHGEARSGVAWLTAMLDAAGPIASRPKSLGIAQARAAKADALISAAGLASFTDDVAQARDFASEGLALFEQIGDKKKLAWALNVGSYVLVGDGDFETARERMERSLALYRELGETAGIIQLTNNLGAVAAHLHDYGSAVRLLEESLTLSRRAGNRTTAARAMNNLGCVLARVGELARAGALARDALTIRHAISEPRGIIESFELLSWLAGQNGSSGQSAWLLGSAHTLRTRHGLAPTVDFLRDLVDESASVALTTLGRERFDAEFARGAAMSTQHAVALALNEQAPPLHRTSHPASVP